MCPVKDPLLSLRSFQLFRLRSHSGHKAACIDILSRLLYSPPFSEMATVTFDLSLNPPAQQFGQSYQSRAQPVPIGYSTAQQTSGFQPAWNNSSYASNYSQVPQPSQQPSQPSYIEVRPTPSTAQGAQTASAATEDKPRSLLGSVWDTLGEVKGSTLSGASGVLDVWKKYADGKNKDYTERKKSEALKSTTSQSQAVSSAAAWSAPVSSQAPTPLQSTQQTGERQTFVERLASGKERWDAKRSKFVSMVPSVGTEKESDYQQPPEGTIILHGHSLRWDEDDQDWKHVHFLHDPETGREVPVTEEIKKILTCETHGLSAGASQISQAGLQSYFGPNVSSHFSSDAPLQQLWMQQQAPPVHSVQHQPFGFGGNGSDQYQSQMSQSSMSYTPGSQWPGLTPAQHYTPQMSQQSFYVRHSNLAY